MLPPGMLERLELVAEVTPAGEARLGQADPGLDAVDVDLLDELAGRPRPVRDLSTPEGRAGPAPAAPGAGRRGARGPHLDPARGGDRSPLRAPSVGHARRRGGGRAAASPGSACPGGRSDRGRWRRSTSSRAPRRHPMLRPTASLLRPMAFLPPRSRNATAHRRSPGSCGAGLLRAEVRERPRRPLAGRPAGLRGARPAGSGLTEAQAAALAIVREAIAAARRDAQLLSTASRVAARRRSTSRRSPPASRSSGPRSCSCPRSRWRPRSSIGCAPTSPSASRCCTRRSGRANGPTSGDASGPARSDVVVGTRIALVAPLADVGLVIVDEEHDAAYKSDRTPRLQARDAAIDLAAIAGAAIVLGSATPSVESMGHARAGRYRRAVAARPARGHRAHGRAPSTCAPSSPPATAGCSRTARRRAGRPSTPRPATGPSS